MYQIEALFSATDPEVDRGIRQRFARTIAKSLEVESRRLGIEGSAWELEILSPHGHVCPMVGFESHHACLIPVGGNARDAHELYCVVDWTCRAWCRSQGDFVLTGPTDEFLEKFTGVSDPAAICGLRAYISVLQGGFGLPRIRRRQRATHVPVLRRTF